MTCSGGRVCERHTYARETGRQREDERKKERETERGTDREDNLGKPGHIVTTINSPVR
jgi:hypothetical protein